MKPGLFVIFLFCFLTGKAQLPVAKNVFIVTIDGIRWQEVFEGPDSSIINNARYTNDIDLAKLLYYDSSAKESRKKLLPFFWNVIARKGRLYGNRLLKNRVNVSNAYKFSYPGYNEILTGYPDLYVNSNRPVENENINVLEYLNSLDEFRNNVVAFTSWNIFPYILNKDRNALPVYSGYDSVPVNGNIYLKEFNDLQQNFINDKKDTRQDALTFIAASEYIRANKPRVMLIGFGECDEDAHRGQYDKYLQHISEADKMIAQLWYYIQSTPEYKDKTTLIITTDHGRGKKKNSWINHDALIKGSGDAWLAVIGPGISPLGEMNVPGQIYQKQIAATVTGILGYNFVANHPVAQPINLTDN
ncbi:MAG TPA: alkaline phosphatase family protein [Chitinophagaceae bacterium]|nr:alkaline phosphatase family protein [Chitinophagaceae bacterium]